MAYTVIYENGGREIGREEAPTKLAEAQAYADEVVAKGQYDRVEVRDADGRLLHQAPRTVRPLPGSTS